MEFVWSWNLAIQNQVQFNTVEALRQPESGLGWGRHTGEVGYGLCGLYGMKEHKKWIILRFIRVTCC